MKTHAHRTVILANGQFPRHEWPLSILETAERVICCDGAVAELLAWGGRPPDAIVGDLDSLPPALRERFADRLHHDGNQDTNDLTKALDYCLAQGWKDIAILGATGLREDHTLGNLSLLVDAARRAPDVMLVSDHALFLPLRRGGTLPGGPGRPVSIFSFDPAVAIRSSGLRYPLRALRLKRWWQATLNECVGDRFSLRFKGGPLLVAIGHARAPQLPAGPLPVALTIAGSDSGGNAGIQADLRAFHALRVHGCTAIAALTAQNPSEVRAVQLTTPALLEQQLAAIFDSYDVAALKTGMLATGELIEVVATCLERQPRPARVIDPVMVASSGARLLADEAIEVLHRRLLPQATLMTPNLPEAEVLLERTIRGAKAKVAAARALARRYGCAVLLKGGHDPRQPARDLLCRREGRRLRLWELDTPMLVDPLSTHGTGCTLSAGIAGALARGRNLFDAVLEGKALCHEAIRTGRHLGRRATVLGMPERLPLDQVRVREIAP